MNASIVTYVNKEVSAKEPVTIGDRYLATSIFELPEDIDLWPERYPEGDCTASQIEKLKNSVKAREYFAQKAIDAGYKSNAVFRPKLKPYIVGQLIEGKYQEKQVDATVVALLVKYAITKPNDYHVIISGDKDMIPAIEVAYPEYTVNVAVATTHPDALTEEHRQSSFSLFSYDFCIPPFILEDKTREIIDGEHIYECKECSKVFARRQPIPGGRAVRPICNPCYQKKDRYR